MTLEAFKSESDFIKVCRCCMTESEENINVSTLINIGDYEVILESLLMECLSVVITKLDFYSPMICMDCIEKISNAYLFKKQCENVDELFTKLYTDYICNKSILEDNLDSKSVIKIEDIQTSDKVEQHSDYRDNEIRPEDEPENVTETFETGTFSCDICPKIFNNKRALTTHARTHNDQCTQCSICSKKVSKLSYKTHLKLHDASKPEKWVCDTCGKNFSKIGNLVRHQKTHSQLRPYECPICGKSFGRPDTFALHKQSHGNKDYQCSICPSAFTTKAYLTMHMKRHDPNNDNRAAYYCELCNQKFKMQLYLKMHLKVDHGKDIKLEEDDINDNEVISGKFECPECEKMYQSKGSLYQHIRIAHKNKEISPKTVCVICGKSYYSSYIKIHMRYHDGDKPFKCRICPKKFISKTHLQTHVKTHLNIRRYSCPDCGKKFARRSHLRIHFRTHSGEKPYKCDTCDKGFAQVGDLNSHKRTHTGEKPFVCKICPSAYTQSSALRGHERRVHSHKELRPQKEQVNKQDSEVSFLD